MEINEALEMMKALSNETRLKIMEWLKNPAKSFQGYMDPLHDDLTKQGGVCVGSIAKRANINQSTASGYMSILHRAGLVKSIKIGKWTYYCRDEEKIKEFLDYLANQQKTLG